MSFLRALAAIPILVAALAGPARGATLAGSGLRCSSKPTRVHSFHVETVWTRKVYRQSEKAVVKVTVTRPAHTDPLGEGIPLPIPPPASVPEAGVTVTTALMTAAWPPPYGYGATDAAGEVTLKIPLKDVPPGAVDASTYASKWTNQGGCPDIEEWGWFYESPGLTVTP